MSHLNVFRRAGSAIALATFLLGSFGQAMAETKIIPVACEDDRCYYDAQGGTPINVDTFDGATITAGYLNWQRINGSYFVHSRYAFVSFDLGDDGQRPIEAAVLRFTPITTGSRKNVTQLNIRSFVDNTCSRCVGMPEVFSAQGKRGDLTSWHAEEAIAVDVTDLVAAAQAGLGTAIPATTRVGLQFWLPHDDPFRLDLEPLTFYASEQGPDLGPTLTVTFAD